MPARCSSQKIKAQMARLGMKTSKLMAVSGLSESTLHRLLTDKPVTTNDRTLQILADALQCSPFDLLRDSEIDQVVKTEADNAMTGVVAEAVLEAVTVVTESLAPETPPETIAEQIPQLPVSAPAALDIPTYIEYLRDSHNDRVDDMQRALQDMRSARNLWRWVSFALFVLLFLAVCYFAWELFNPDKGLTRVLWDAYISLFPPAYTQPPTP